MKRVLLLAGLLIMGCGGSPSPTPSLTAPVSSDGRARLQNLGGASAVPAIDGLGASAAQFIYGRVALFSDQTPDLTGTVAQACQGTARSTGLVGALPVYNLLVNVQPDTGQSLLAAVQASDLEARCRDAFSVVGAPQQAGGRNPEVQRLLGPDISTMAKFHSLRLLWPQGVPPQQRAALKQLRDTLSLPVDGSPLQKVLKVSDVAKYLNGTFDPKVFGFQAVVADVASLRTPPQVIEGLRLDYSGGFQGETEVGILTYAQTPDFQLIIPYSPANGGNRTDAYPFAGNGFTATVQANAIPEWVAPSIGVALRDGATLEIMRASGVRELQASFQSGHWVTPGGTVLTRFEPRESVEQWRSYQDRIVYAISRDSRFEYVYYQGDRPGDWLQNAVQVGPREWRGQISLLD